LAIVALQGSKASATRSNRVREAANVYDLAHWSRPVPARQDAATPRWNPAMRTLLRHAALLCLLAPVIAMASEPAEALLLQRANALVAAQLAFDQPALEGLLARDYLEVSPVGDVDTRDEVIGFYSADAKAKAATGPMPIGATLDDVQVRVAGDAATLVARETIRMPSPDGPRAIAMRVQFQFRLVDGQWCIATTQYTGIRPPARNKPD
jgi:ketosteroid isomerase-like protein